MKNIKSLLGIAFASTLIGSNIGWNIQFNQMTNNWDKAVKKNYSNFVKEDYKKQNIFEKAYTFGEYLAADKYLKQNK